MRRLLPIKLMLFTLVMAACVTINVYFPAAAAEKAADQIIDTVTSRGVALPVQPASPGAPGSGAPPVSPPGDGTGKPRAALPDHGAPGLLAQASWHLLALVVPVAHAQSANLDVSTPEIRALTASMQQRFGQLSRFFDAGAVGLTGDGMVAVRDANAVSLADRALVTRLVAEDNKDRAALYAEIARANGHAEWEGDIRRTFARRWIERGAQPGWYYQDAGGAWQKK
jgi:uncharacterized protein YdbL (DUF1318 family)